MKVALRDVHAVLDQARAKFVQTPQHARLFGMTRSLTEPERFALAYIEAVLNVAGSLGVDTAHLKVEWDDSDSL